MASDLHRVDQNLSAIRALEGAWSLPAIPDEVKLDLAGNALMTPAALGVLFNGLDADLTLAQKRLAMPTRFNYGIEEPVNPSYAYKPKEAIGRAIAGITGLPQPQVYEVQAPQRLKQRLVDGGYLDLTAEEVESDMWLPEYSYAARQLNFDDMSSRFQGNKPGSISIEGIMDIVDEWLTPRGLYRAAVELDLWWDTGNIKREFQEWDDKVAQWREDPLNPRKLVDMVTGPIDDLLFPAINIALMFTGIAEVIAVGRGTMMGVKGAQAIAGMYRGGKGLNFAARAADDIARFGRQSWLAGKVDKAGVLGERSAHLMNQWRKNGAVILAKKANQQVIRAGFVSNLEQLVDADRGGQSLNRFTEGEIGESVDQVFSNPLVDWGVDLLLMPPNIFNPGTFSKPLKAGVKSIQDGFLNVTENQDLLTAYHRPIVQFLEESRSPQAAEAYQRLVNQKGMKQALSRTFFDGDDVAMGAALAYTTTMAGIDSWARATADVVAGGQLHELNSATRSAFHRARNATAARLKVLDPDNVEDLITHIAKYGDPGEVMTKGTRSARRFQQNRRQVMERYLESADQAAARQGRVPARHTRFVGGRNPDTGVVEWRPLRGGDLIEGDPFFVDLHADELRNAMGDLTDQVMSGDLPLPDNFANRYTRHDASGALRHNRLSEAGNVRLYDPEKLQALKGVAKRHNDLRAGYMKEIMDDLSPEVLEQYVYEVLPTFGRWDQFVEAAGEIRDAVVRGELSNVQFVSPISDANRALAAIPWTPNEEKWTNELFGMMLELPGDEQLAGDLMKGIFSPFARNVDPQLGNFTVAGLDTVTKQEALAFAATAKRAVMMVKAVRRLKALPNAREALRITGTLLDEGAQVTKQGLREVLAETLGSAALTERTLDELTKVAKAADEAGVGLEQIESVLVKKLADIDGLPQWAERYMVPTQLDRAKDLVDEVQGKIKEVQKQAYFMASEVQGAPEWLGNFLGERQYKLVYGVEFAQPFDLDGIMPHFADATRRHLYQKRLGSFFDRQEPAVVSAVKVRKVRDALHARLSTVEDGLPLNLGDMPDAGNADMNKVVNDLWDILNQVQDDARHKLDTLEDARFFERVFQRANLSRVPLSLDRLGSELGSRRFINLVMGKGYSRAQASAMFQGLQSSQALGVRYHGLYAVESKLRSNPNLINATRVLGAVGGSIGGHYAAAATISEGDDPNSPENLIRRAVGTVGGGILGGVAGFKGARTFKKSMDEGGRALRYAYLADNIANIRDQVRFSLSPIFDASRYSEAIILNQIGDMPPGLRNLRVNQSPTSFRRMIAKELRQGGMDVDTANRVAKAEWHKVQGQFAASARGDFDWEVIDEAGRRFSSVGILGFSPVDWMTSTFGHMVRGGANPKDAYEAVRHIYTYGTTGRSAAELSMNFVFFPFSFTKKTVGHAARFFGDDLSRLVLLHDSMAAYSMLDDHFELSEEWRDRMPILQKAHRLNLLAYGVGLGQFGGVNAPILQAGSRLPGVQETLDLLPGQAEIVNAFIPQMVPMNNADDANSAWDTVRGMLPVVNDVNTLIGSLVEQGYVLGSPEHLTRQAEQRHAWDEWRTFQEGVENQLSEAGITWNQAVRAPELNALIQREKTKISLKYPSWKLGMGDGIAHSTAIDMELKERLLAPQEPADLLLASFDQMVRLTEDAVGYSFDSSPERFPPELFRLARKTAIEYAQEDPAFLRLYNRFYRRNLGDIVENL